MVLNSTGCDRFTTAGCVRTDYTVDHEHFELITGPGMIAK